MHGRREFEASVHPFNLPALSEAGQSGFQRASLALSTIYDVEKAKSGIVTECDRHLSINLSTSFKNLPLTRRTS